MEKVVDGREEIELTVHRQPNPILRQPLSMPGIAPNQELRAGDSPAAEIDDGSL